MAINFHAFTDGDAIASGRVREFVIRGSKARFKYGYSWLGVNVTGKFSGTVRADGQIGGKWDETSKDPIGGRTYWEGKAVFTVRNAGGRRTLVGVWGWTTRKMNERWVVEEGT